MKSSRRPFWIVIALFFAPLAIAFALYYGAHGWRPAPHTKGGELIDPARPLPPATLLLANGGATDMHWLEKKWTFLYVGAGSCNEQCRTALVHMRQTRLALGKELVRVQNAFISTSACCDRDYLAQEHKDLVVIDAGPAIDFLAQFPRYDNIPVEQAGRIYIVDPLGNLMMSYAPDAPSRALLEDTKKLLSLSHIG
jgi:cytochrome oxidase Cu insertion factor (SCO1/SenC/PrrC family)